MSRGGELNNAPGNDFQLPDEILSVLPTDSHELLDLAHKITSMAMASQVSELESEVGQMRQTLDEKDSTVHELEETVSGLNHACQEAESRLKSALDDNTKLAMERDQLAMTTRKLSQDLGKLEKIKRQLIQFLSDDNFSQDEIIDIRTSDQSVSKAYPHKDEDVNRLGHSYSGRSIAVGDATDEGCTLRIDGNELFREARSRLSYEQFSAFLANIKNLYVQKQTQEETLRKAEEIFGTDNKDLFVSFHLLLNHDSVQVALPKIV